MAKSLELQQINFKTATFSLDKISTIALAIKLKNISSQKIVSVPLCPKCGSPALCILGNI